MPRTNVPKCIKRWQRETARTARTVRLMWDVAEAAESLAACDAVEPSQGWATIDSIVGLKLCVYVTVKRENLADLLRHAAQLGYHQVKEMENDGELLYHLGRAAKREITLVVSLAGDTCRRVQVGTREVPVYRVECGEVQIGGAA